MVLSPLVGYYECVCVGTIYHNNVGSIVAKKTTRSFILIISKEIFLLLQSQQYSLARIYDEVLNFSLH